MSRQLRRKLRHRHLQKENGHMAKFYLHEGIGPSPCHSLQQCPSLPVPLVALICPARAGNGALLICIVEYMDYDCNANARDSSMIWSEVAEKALHVTDWHGIIESTSTHIKDMSLSLDFHSGPLRPKIRSLYGGTPEDNGD